MHADPASWFGTEEVVSVVSCRSSHASGKVLVSCGSIVVVVAERAAADGWRWWSVFTIRRSLSLCCEIESVSHQS